MQSLADCPGAEWGSEREMEIWSLTRCKDKIRCCAKSGLGRPANRRVTSPQSRTASTAYLQLRGHTSYSMRLINPVQCCPSWFQGYQHGRVHQNRVTHPLIGRLLCTDTIVTMVGNSLVGNIVAQIMSTLQQTPITELHARDHAA